MSTPFRPAMARQRWLLLVLVWFVVSCTPDHPPASAVTAPTVSTRCVFLAVGRQGYGDAPTRAVALSMEQLARERGDINFTMLLGDNFHPTGVSAIDDPQWDSKFESLYDGAHLKGMPFYAVVGKHDHQGNVQAQLDYSRLKRGSGRWQMDGPFYAKDFGTLDGQPLVRIVFLDSVSLQGVGTDGILPMSSARNRDEQVRFLREQFAAATVQPHWKIVATHYPSRSLTTNIYSGKRVMTSLLPVLREVGVDIVISANDRFQQVLDVAGEPLHVSVNGGAPKVDELPVLDTPSQLVAPQKGFALISTDENHLTVELFDAQGALSHTRTRAR